MVKRADRHSDEVIRSRTGPRREPDVELTPTAEFQHAGIGEAHLVAWALAPASVPLFTAGSTGPIAYTRAVAPDRTKSHQFSVILKGP